MFIFHYEYTIDPDLTFMKSTLVVETPVGLTKTYQEASAEIRTVQFFQFVII